MSFKRKDIRICHPDQGFGRRGGRRIGREGRWPNKPKRLNVSCSNQIEGFRAKQTQRSYLSLNLSVRAEIVAFFRKFQCERSIKDSALAAFPCSPAIAR